MTFTPQPSPGDGAPGVGPVATQLPPVDQGNPHLMQLPASLTVTNARIAGPNITDTGDRVVATFRVGSATVTAFLTRADAEQWSAMLVAGARKCSPLVIPT